MDTKGSLQHQESISLDLDKTITFSQNVDGEYVVIHLEDNRVRKANRYAESVTFFLASLKLS
jgi:hypothetical protein